MRNKENIPEQSFIFLLANNSLQVTANVQFHNDFSHPSPRYLHLDFLPFFHPQPSNVIFRDDALFLSVESRLQGGGGWFGQFRKLNHSNACFQQVASNEICHILNSKSTSGGGWWTTNVRHKFEGRTDNNWFLYFSKASINLRRKDYCKSFLSFLKEADMKHSSDRKRAASLSINNKSETLWYCSALESSCSSSACSSLRIKFYEFLCAWVEIYGFLNGSQADLWVFIVQFKTVPSSMLLLANTWFICF